MKHPKTLLALAAAVLAGACASPPDWTEPKFLTDYSQLSSADATTARYVDRSAGRYVRLMLDPIEFRAPLDQLDEAQREELRRHTDGVFRGVALAAGFDVTDEPGPGVAHVRIAISEVGRSAWWASLHKGPAPKAAAAAPAAATKTPDAKPVEGKAVEAKAAAPGVAEVKAAEVKAGATGPFAPVATGPASAKAPPAKAVVVGGAGAKAPGNKAAESKVAATPPADPQVAFGLAAEAEVVDAETGKQLGAVVRTFGNGSWAEVPPYQRLRETKAAVDRWAMEATDRLIAWREQRRQP